MSLACTRPRSRPALRNGSLPALALCGAENGAEAFGLSGRRGEALAEGGMAPGNHIIWFDKGRSPGAGLIRVRAPDGQAILRPNAR